MAVFAIDSTQSRIRAVPSTFAGGFVVAGTRVANIYGIEAQEPGMPGVPGSLDSTVSGTLTADVNGSTLTFTGQNLLDVPRHPLAPFLPQVPGSPGIEDNFGANVLEDEVLVGEAAIRDAVAQLVGGMATLGQRPTDLEFILASGIFDYRVEFFQESYPLTPSPLVSNGTSDLFTGSVNGTIHIPFFLEYEYSVITAGDSLLVLEGEIVATRVAPSLVGDYNGNQVVDAADFVVWRDRVGTSNPMPNDPIGGTIGAAQYNQWKANFGKTPGSGSVLAVVPEPTSIYLIFTAWLIMFYAGRRNSQLKKASR